MKRRGSFGSPRGRTRTNGSHCKLAIDYGLVFRERLKQIGLDASKEEYRLRAIEHTANSCRANTGLDLESAKRLVLEAIATKEKTL
jgi:hypothetical protein